MDTTLIKSELKALILCFAKAPEKNSISLYLDNSVSDQENPTSIAKKLFDVVEECKNPIKSFNRVTDLDTQLSKEIDLFVSGCFRVEYLSWNYCFSTAPYVDYKIRSVNMLDALIPVKNYLNYYYYNYLKHLFWNPNNFLKLMYLCIYSLCLFGTFFCILSFYFIFIGK